MPTRRPHRRRNRAAELRAWEARLRAREERVADLFADAERTLADAVTVHHRADQRLARVVYGAKAPDDPYGVMLAVRTGRQDIDRSRGGVQVAVVRPPADKDGTWTVREPYDLPLDVIRLSAERLAYGALVPTTTTPAKVGEESLFGMKIVSDPSVPKGTIVVRYEESIVVAANDPDRR